MILEIKFQIKKGKINVSPGTDSCLSIYCIANLLQGDVIIVSCQ
jgi:hypothetical protein